MKTISKPLKTRPDRLSAVQCAKMQPKLSALKAKWQHELMPTAGTDDKARLILKSKLIAMGETLDAIGYYEPESCLEELIRAIPD